MEHIQNFIPRTTNNQSKITSEGGSANLSANKMSKFTQKDSEGNELRNQVMYATNGSNFNIEPDFNFNKYMADKYENQT